MRIGYLAESNESAAGIVAQLERALPGDTIILLQPAKLPISSDVEVLLAADAVDLPMLQRLPELVLIQTMSDGYETVDVGAATAMGIWVSYAPGDLTGNADSVAEYAVLLLLASTRHLRAALALVYEESAREVGVCPALAHKSVCIVGLGAIGTRVARRLSGFDVRLSAVDRQPTLAPKNIPTRPLEELRESVADADFVVLCIRSTPENANMINAPVLAAMKRGATLVNIARGSLIDERALYDAIRSGHIRGAALDVVQHEPVRSDNLLCTLPQVIVTPHVAGLTDLMVEGTVRYVSEVINQLKSGAKIASLLNEPKTARRPLPGPGPR